MEKIICGIDTTKKVTAKMVRDAIITCFIDAHALELEMTKEYYTFKTEEEFEEFKQLDISYMIKSKFEIVGGDFDKPTKADLKKVCDRLADFASKFRDKATVQEHYATIMQLIELIQE